MNTNVRNQTFVRRYGTLVQYATVCCDITAAQFLRALAKLRKATIRFIVAVRMAVSPLGAARLSLGRIFVKFRIRVFSRKISQENFKISYNPTPITGMLYEDRCTFLIMYRSFILGIRNVSKKDVGKFKTYILCLITFISEFFLVYEILTYLLTYLLTYSLHGAESFLRS